jgi:hypothetical protein
MNPWVKIAKQNSTNNKTFHPSAIEKTSSGRIGRNNIRSHFFTSDDLFGIPSKLVQENIKELIFTQETH